MSEDINKNGMVSEDDMPEMPVHQAQAPEEKPILSTEIQTAKRTLARKFAPPSNPDKGDSKKSDATLFAMDFFLAMTDESLKYYGELLSVWLEHQTAEQDLNAGRIDQARFNAVDAQYNTICEERLPNRSQDDINEFCRRFYEFSQSTIDWYAFNNGQRENPNFSNRVQRGEGVVGNLITAMKPGSRNNRKFTISEMMRRDYRRTSSEPENFDTFLPNSFVHFRTARPDVLELGRLIKDIAGTIKGFVRSISANTQTISRIAGYRVIFDYLMSKTVNTNIKDTSDFNELAGTILLSDFKQMLVELTAAAHWEGVDFNFICLSKNCNYEKTRSIDLKETVWVDMSQMTDEQAAEYANMMNMVKTISREDAARLQNQTHYPFDTKIYSEDKRTYLVIKQPTLLTAFQCFDFVREKLDPEVAALRNNVLDNKQFEQELQSMMARLSFCEYFHWIDEIHFVAEPGSDGEDVVYKRSDDPEEFNKGLYEILGSNSPLNESMMKFVVSHSEKMTFSVVGIPNFTCPKCGTPSSDPELNPFDGHSITPYDPFMHFFTRSQLEQRRAIYRLGVLDDEIR